jgi:antitoxin Phd
LASGTWSLAQAKAKLSEVVEKAQRVGPQYLTKNGKDAVVVVSVAEWDRRNHTPPSLFEMLESSPLREEGVEFERDPDVGRDFRFDE